MRCNQLRRSARLWKGLSGVEVWGRARLPAVPCYESNAARVFPQPLEVVPFPRPKRRNMNFSAACRSRALSTLRRRGTSPRSVAMEARARTLAPTLVGSLLHVDGVRQYGVE